jgi:thiamine biosynthesis lipoprotein
MTTRRRFLSILAGSAILPTLGTSASADVASWKGVVLGANARIILDHPQADRLISMALAEINRLESLFSLHHTDSQLSHLNRDGHLANPAFEMVELLSLSSRIHRRTDGAFDPSVQPLWALYAEQVSAGKRPTQQQIDKTLRNTGWQHLHFDTTEIRFSRTGMALTLNGIAQGYIADKVTALLRRNGVENVMVNTGEIMGTGHAPDGRDWQVHLGDASGKQIPLNNRAVATSAPLGTSFDQNGKIGHIIDPRTGQTGAKHAQVSVIARTAAEADGLSTAFCLMTAREINAAKGDTTVFL